ncbi:MAG: hypothetical protein P4L96_03610 [Rhodoferax sp.]|nr:hypothetical protein [Rhodoferax sp.]
MHNNALILDIEGTLHPNHTLLLPCGHSLVARDSNLELATLA